MISRTDPDPVVTEQEATYKPNELFKGSFFHANYINIIKNWVSLHRSFILEQDSSKNIGRWPFFREIFKIF